MKVTKTMIGSVACAALLGVQGCAVSSDPYVNGMATGALATAAVGWLFYSANDGYYYDHNYNRMPRHYRPPRNMEIRRIDNMDQYRRLHPIGSQMRTAPPQHRPIGQPNHHQPIRNNQHPQHLMRWRLEDLPRRSPQPRRSYDPDWQRW